MDDIHSPGRYDHPMTWRGQPWPLGGRPLKDPASRAYPAPAVAASEVRSQHHKLSGAVLDQGHWWNPWIDQYVALGSCTGNAEAHLLNCSPHHTPWGKRRTEDDAVEFYAHATDEDPFPGRYDPHVNAEDTGSSMITILRLARQAGRIGTFTHVFTGAEGVAHAIQTGPVMLATVWLYRMFYPDRDGTLTIDGPEAGWHCYLINRYDARRKRFGGPNSWGSGWGRGGHFWMYWNALDDLLLKHQGEASLPLPA